jgi:hypothetical protein
MKKFLFLLVFLFTAVLGKAQDTIVKKNGDILRVKVTEIGTEEIRFKSYGVTDSPVIVMKRSEVKKVVVSGQVIFDDKEPVKQKTEDILVKQDGSTLKINVLEIGTNEVKFKLLNDPDGPTISIDRADIRSLKVGDQVVIDNKKETEDFIVKKDGSTLKVKVIEMGTDVVTYKLFGNPDGPTLNLKKKDIKTVKIDNQIVYEFKEDPYSVNNNSILDKTNDVKFEFFSPLFNHLAFSYEWMEKPGFNIEAGFGIIGVGVNGLNNGGFSGAVKDKPKGIYLRGGPKFLLGSGSDIEIEGGRIAHPLKGRYFAIDAVLNTMTRGFETFETTYNSATNTYTTTQYNWRNRYQSLSLNLIYGRQNIYGNAITVGYYIGIGYGFEGVSVASGTEPPSANTNQYSYFDPQRFSHVYAGKDFPLTFTYGLTIGYIHKPKNKVGDKNFKNNPRAPK